MWWSWRFRRELQAGTVQRQPSRAKTGSWWRGVLSQWVMTWRSRRSSAVQRGSAGSAKASSTSRSSATTDAGPVKRISASQPRALRGARTRSDNPRRHRRSRVARAMLDSSCARICSRACGDKSRHWSGGVTGIGDGKRLSTGGGASETLGPSASRGGGRPPGPAGRRSRARSASPSARSRAGPARRRAPSRTAARRRARGGGRGAARGRGSSSCCRMACAIEGLPRGGRAGAARAARVIGSTRTLRVWAYPAPADLRKGFDGLQALVAAQLQRDPLSGDCYLFVNRTRRRAKVLLWDGTGLCIYQKRLEQGPLRGALGPGGRAGGGADAERARALARRVRAARAAPRSRRRS